MSLNLFWEEHDQFWREKSIANCPSPVIYSLNIAEELESDNHTSPQLTHKKSAFCFI